MKKYAFAAIACCTGIYLHAQTLRIAHRSHSGAAASLNAAAAGRFGEIDLGPWQAPDEKKKKPLAADTVKVIKVKPWKPVKDSLPPKVNPVYTKRSG